MTTSALDRRAARLRWCLRLYSGLMLLAFFPALMPNRWIVEVAEWLGYPDFPEHPVVWFLARQLSLMYGLLGVIGYWASMTLPARIDLVRVFALLLLLLGLAQYVLDPWAGLPWRWTIGESLGPLLGFAILWWLIRSFQTVDADS